MKALAIRESRQLARVVQTQVSRLVNDAIAKGIVKVALCGNRYSPVPFSAFKLLRDRLRRRAIWQQALEQLAKERVEQLVAEELRRQARIAPHPAQLSFPDFDRLPTIRIDSHGVYEA